MVDQRVNFPNFAPAKEFAGGFLYSLTPNQAGNVAGGKALETIVPSSRLPVDGINLAQSLNNVAENPSIRNFRQAASASLDFVATALPANPATEQFRQLLKAGAKIATIEDYRTAGEAAGNITVAVPTAITASHIASAGFVVNAGLPSAVGLTGLIGNRVINNERYKQEDTRWQQTSLGRADDRLAEALISNGTSILLENLEDDRNLGANPEKTDLAIRQIKSLEAEIQIIRDLPGNDRTVLNSISRQFESIARNLASNPDGSLNQEKFDTILRATREDITPDGDPQHGLVAAAGQPQARVSGRG